jgi:hypothetical protein
MPIIIHSGSLKLPVTQHSKFNLQMLQKHVDEAAEFVAQCQKKNKSILDVCGEKPLSPHTSKIDLFFF